MSSGKNKQSAHQIPSDRHPIFLVRIPESDCPWSWVPGHSRELARGKLGGGILFPSVHGLPRPNRAYRDPPGIRKPSCNVVLSCRLDFTDRLLATPVVSSAQNVGALADMDLAPLLVNIYDLDAPPFDLPCHWTEGQNRKKLTTITYTMGGFSVIFSTGLLGTIVATWRNDPVWRPGTVWLLWCIEAARPKAAPVSVGVAYLTPVTSYIKAILKRKSAHLWWCNDQISLSSKDLIAAPPNQCQFH